MKQEKLTTKPHRQVTTPFCLRRYKLAQILCVVTKFTKSFLQNCFNSSGFRQNHFNHSPGLYGTNHRRMVSDWNCVSLRSLYCLCLCVVMATAVRVEVRRNNTGLFCQPLSSDSRPVGEIIIWQRNGQSLLAAELSEFSDGDSIRCVVWSESQRVNWSPVVIVNKRRDDILAIEGVTSVWAHSNELLNLPPTIVILQQSFNYQKISSVVGHIVAFCNVTSSEEREGLLSKPPNTFDSSTVLQNPAATFSVGNFALQLNLSHPMFNFREGRLYVFISVVITGKGGSSDSLHACYKVMKKDDAVTVVQPDTTTSPETSIPPQENSTQTSMPSTVSSSSEKTAIPSSPPTIKEYIFYLLLGLTACFATSCCLCCCILVVVLWKRNFDCFSHPNVDQIASERCAPSQASNAGSNEPSEEVRLGRKRTRHSPHANLLRDHSEGVHHQDVNLVPPPLGLFTHCSTPNSFVTLPGEEPSTTASFAGLPSATSLPAAPFASETDPSAAQINYVRTRPDRVNLPGPSIVNFQKLVPYDNRAPCVYLSMQQHECRPVAVGDTTLV